MKFGNLFKYNTIFFIVSQLDTKYVSLIKFNTTLFFR